MNSEIPVSADARSSHCVDEDTEIGVAGTHHNIDDLQVIPLTVVSGAPRSKQSGKFTVRRKGDTAADGVDERDALNVLPSSSGLNVGKPRRKKSGKLPDQSKERGSAADGDGEVARGEPPQQRGSQHDEALIGLLKEHELYGRPDPNQRQYRLIWEEIWKKVNEEGHVLKGKTKDNIQKHATQLRFDKMKEMEAQKERLKDLEEAIKEKEQQLKKLEDDLKREENIRKVAENVGGGDLDEESEEWKSVEVNVTTLIDEKCDSAMNEINKGVSEKFDNTKIEIERDVSEKFDKTRIEIMTGVTDLLKKILGKKN